MLTEAGKLLVARCEAHFSAIADVTQEVLDGVSVVGGTLRIAAPSDFFDWFPLRWIKEFRAMHPGVRLEIFAQDALVDVIGDGIDIAFRAGKLEDSRLIATVLASTAVVLAASDEYLLERGEPRSLEDLASHDCLTLRSAPNQSQRDWLSRGPAARSGWKCRSRFSANAMGLLRDAAVEGLGIALLPEMLIRDDLDAGRCNACCPRTVSRRSACRCCIRAGSRCRSRCWRGRAFAVARFGGRGTRP